MIEDHHIAEEHHGEEYHNGEEHYNTQYNILSLTVVLLTGLSWQED